MKKILTYAFVGIILPAVVIISGTVLLFTPLMEMANETEEVQADTEESELAEEAQVESFDITGSRSGDTYTLNFNFSAWKIEKVSFKITGTSGRISKIVDMPEISSGNRKDMAYQKLRLMGLNAAAAAGLMANIDAEGTDYKSCTEEGHGGYRGKTVMNKGYGLFQWTNTSTKYGTSWRRRDVINYLENKGIDPKKDSDAAFLAELEYALNEDPSVTKKLKKCTDAGEAARIWCLEWERPQYKEKRAEERAKNAITIFKKYQGTNYRATVTGKAQLTINYTVEDDEVLFTGTLAGQPIAGSFKTSGTIKGSGEYGEGASVASGTLAKYAQTQLGNKRSIYDHGGQAWCAYFVSYCIQHTTVKNKGYTANGNCSGLLDMIKKRGTWHGKSGTPKSGDIVFFDWNDNGVPDHVGIAISAKGNKVITVEGNTSCDEGKHRKGSVVEKKTRPLSLFLGWGTP